MPDHARADPTAPAPDRAPQIAAASFASGEPFLALMAGIGALMTAWAGGLTLLRG